MKRGSTFFLRGVIFILGLGVLALCIFAIPVLIREVVGFIPQLVPVKYLMFIGLYATAVLFYTALYQALNLLKYIDHNTAFSELSAKALRKIKYSGVGMSVIYLLGMPVVYLVAEKDDAPGLILMAFAYSCTPIVVSVFAAVLEKLVRSAIDIKSENDLTV